ncbi:septum formation family protein [Zafaria sp. Z1313]|uniref:septum formation family protein n=1 Tax=unclassified Zafaria TaxID=2828765 RepID=UPI002E796F6A|nr:septum formation family protein [Zafaria sp. J156]MEE1621382.1 septum formation family protein [Zafaria sp. J156]
MEEPHRSEPSPYQPARPAQTQVRPIWGLSPVWLVVAALAVVLLVVYATGRLVEAGSAGESPAAEVERSAPGIDGIIARDVPAEQFLPGDCLSGFTGALEPATVVACTTRHSAQLIGIAELEDGAYPGDGEIAAAAEASCKEIQLDPDAVTAGRWNYEFSRPSQGTWQAGDRSVACFLVLVEGTVSRSLLPPDGT